MNMTSKNWVDNFLSSASPLEKALKKELANSKSASTLNHNYKFMNQNLQSSISQNVNNGSAVEKFVPQSSGKGAET
eukprot:CAMPEP_0170566884 /NCGR_PEP_ID=MMETSP0211-20121228/80126_1 /TAXON_ID=311385 /ORGANISM="Pseudokeronopsis sp., Strain OXSARD2" /LENGTH=75 /DNA_ID=CAMNT_0010888187 /DNA_START=844 /DNA_END=1071 /DNA_ORIENTATION=-